MQFICTIFITIYIHRNEKQALKPKSNVQLKIFLELIFRYDKHAFYKAFF